jgi:GntR family transcriptional regulator/MocR family aminotransferase
MWSQLFQLSFRSRISLQAQIREMLVAAILDGHLPGGTALPSTRTLAEQLGVARNTVALAYELLVAEGFLRTKSRSGHFVNPQMAGSRLAVPRPGPAAGAAPVDWTARMHGAVSAQRNIVKPADWHRYPYPIIYGQVDPALVPIAGWRECSLQAMSATEIRGWAGDRIDADDPLLIEQIQTRLLARRGVFANPDEILVTVGAQHALFLLATLLVNGDTHVGVEDPGYPDARNIFAARTPHVARLPLDGQGLALTPALDDCQYVYVTPSHQCPTNVTMPLARRAALLDWAERGDRVLIEDDYEVEMGLEGRAEPALKSLDRAGRVVYVGSLSKTLAPGIRIGFIVGSAALVREARALRRLMLRHPAANNQRSVALFLAMGYHDTLLRRLRQAYAERSAVLADALRRHLPDVAFATVPGASSYWLRFCPGTDTRALALAVARRGVLIEPGDVFFAATPPAVHARLGFAAIATERIEAGVAELAACHASSSMRAVGR